jgi:hypothetical protein
MGISRGSATPDTMPSHVRDISTANCVFCPYGAGVEPGDRLYIYDEKTVFGRQQRERMVEVKTIKQFRSTGRVITLDLAMISLEEVEHIAADSELGVEALLTHRPGTAGYDEKRPPVVVYFEACDEDDTTGSHSQPGSAISLDGRSQTRQTSAVERVFGKLFARGKKPTAH